MSNSTLSVLFVDSYPQVLAGQQETLTTVLGRTSHWDIVPTILTPAKGVFVDRLREQGYSVDILPQPTTIATYGGAVYGYNFLGKLRMVLQVFGYVARLRQDLRERSVHAVFCNDMRGLLTVGVAARLIGVPVLIWDKLDKPHGFYDALQLPLVARNLMITKSVAKKYPAWQRRIWKNRMKVIYDGIDTSRYSVDKLQNERDASRAALALNTSDTVLAIIGTITKRKGHDLLLAALKRALLIDPSLRLLVIGAPSDESQNFAEEMYAAAPSGVHWLGYRSDIEALLPAIDIVVSPSRHEGMGRVNVEAMAAEIPVIGSSHTGIAEVVVDGETGFLIDPEDTDALSQAILSLSQDKALRAYMGKNARARAEAEFDATKQIDVVLQEIVKVARP